MIARELRVRNFRSIHDDTLHLDDLTALVGSNGSGKSSFLKALSLFYESSKSITASDFHANDTGREIVISVAFHVETPVARELFARYIQDQTLTIERVFQWNEGKPASKLHGSTMQHPRFVDIRRENRAGDQRPIYQSLRGDPLFGDLPDWASQTQAHEAMARWEADHPELCSRFRDDGAFFGFKQVGEGYLGRFSKYIFVPAVRDASEDAAEGKDTTLSNLMDLVVRSAIIDREDFRAFKSETQSRYEDLIDPARLEELPQLGERLTSTLKTFVPEAAVSLSWAPPEEITIPVPKAEVKLVEDGYESPVGNVGHGLQRAYIFTMLQHLAQAQKSLAAEGDNEDHVQEESPNILLAIEEPELYQHPNRQRHFAQILMRLAEGTIPGVAGKTQVVYSTHSPLFVGIDRINQIRLLTKKDGEPHQPKQTTCAQTSLSVVAQKLWEACGSEGDQFTEDSLKPRLKAVMTPMINEGFFAEKVVLVEGEEDLAILQGFARVKDVNLESLGISIIPCGGKNNIDRPSAIFSAFGIPVYIIWDSDKDKDDSDPRKNHILLRLSSAEVVDWPSVIDDHFACFETDLNSQLRSEIGEEEFSASLSKAKSDYHISSNQSALKNAYVIATIIEIAAGKGISSPTCEQLLTKILRF